jgi:putative oxidoreductase
MDLRTSKAGRWPGGIETWGPIPLRLIVGYGFIAHGISKLMNGPERFAASLQGLGVPAPELMSWATVIIELAGGSAILLGAFVVYASVPMTVTMLVAAFKVHLQFGFSSIKLRSVTASGPQFGPPGYEVCLLYVACMAALVLGGAGPLSIDGWLKRRAHNE